MEKKSVLIVEDDNIVSLDLMTTLENMGYKVIGTIGTGEEAFLALEKYAIDIVILDIQLRGEIDGIQAAEIINKKYKLPLIYLTAYTDDYTLSRAKLTEPYGYIAKPFNHRELHTTIEMALYKHRMEKRVRDSEELLSVTLRSIGDAVITTDALGIIRFMNPAAESLLSLDKEKAVGKNLKSIGVSFYSEVKKRVQMPFTSKTFEDNKPKFGRYFLKNNLSTHILVECYISPILGHKNDLNGVVYVIRDITERNKYEEMQSRLVSIVESSEDAIIGSTFDGKIMSWNKGAEHIFGYTAAEVKDKNLSILTPPFYPNELPEILDQLKDRKSIKHYETVRQTKNGAVINVSLSASPIKDLGGTITGASIIARDITHKKRLEKEIREIGNRERLRVGQDLHDSLGQELIGVSLQVKALENRLKMKNLQEETALTNRISNLVKQATMRTKELAKGLIPLSLKSQNLQDALQELADYVESIHSLKISCAMDENLNIEDQVVFMELYRITQEAINNVVKHSNATEAQIKLSREDSEICLSVKDNGKGMKAQKGDGLGSGIMRYRANMINAHLEIYSPEEGGTVVSCRLPLQNIGEEDNGDKRI